MIYKSIIFDLDGVLVDSKDIHFNALNLALASQGPSFVITRQEQDSVFEGLTTRGKLDILTKTKNLDPLKHESIWMMKQHFTASLFRSVNKDYELISLCKHIKDSGIKIGVASNAIRMTVDNLLDSLGIADLVDISLCNEDVVLPKPNNEIYVKAMGLLQSDAEHCVIFEDSDIGQTAATQSGAKLFPVINRSSIDLEYIKEAIEYLNATT